jgi:hypothetical protein
MIDRHFAGGNSTSMDDHWQKTVESIKRKYATQRGSLEDSHGASGIGKIDP